MDLWAYEMARWAPQMVRSVCEKVLRAYEMVRSVCVKVLQAYGKVLPVYEMVLRGPHGMVLRRAIV